MVTLPTLIPSPLPIHKNAIPSQMTGDFLIKKRGQLLPTSSTFLFPASNTSFIGLLHKHGNGHRANSSWNWGDVAG